MPFFYKPFIRNSGCYSPHVKFYMGNFTTQCAQLQEIKEKKIKFKHQLEFELF